MGRLVAALDDPSPLVAQAAVRGLNGFEAEDHSAGSRAELARHLAAERPSSELVLAVGAARIESARGRLSELAGGAAERPGVRTRVAWSAQLALARMGDGEALAAVLAREAAEESLVQRAARLWQDLAYTRRPEALGVLVAALDGEERLPAAMEGRPGVPAAQYAADAIASSLRRSPVRRRYIGTYTSDEIARLRARIEEMSR